MAGATKSLHSSSKQLTEVSLALFPFCCVTASASRSEIGGPVATAMKQRFPVVYRSRVNVQRNPAEVTAPTPVLTFRAPLFGGERAIALGESSPMGPCFDSVWMSFVISSPAPQSRLFIAFRVLGNSLSATLFHLLRIIFLPLFQQPFSTFRVSRSPNTGRFSTNPPKVFAILAVVALVGVAFTFSAVTPSYALTAFSSPREVPQGQLRVAAPAELGSKVEYNLHSPDLNLVRRLDCGKARSEVTTSERAVCILPRKAPRYGW